MLCAHEDCSAVCTYKTCKRTNIRYVRNLCLIFVYILIQYSITESLIRSEEVSKIKCLLQKIALRKHSNIIEIKSRIKVAR